jgi:tetratricopeptide (TPR) repeat protein
VRRLDAGWEDRPEVEAAVRIAIGESYNGLGLFELAVPQAERAHALAVEQLGARSPLALRAMHLHGVALVAMADPAGVARLEECAALHEEVLGAGHVDTLRVSMDLAMLQLSMGEADLARQRLEAIEARHLESGGPDAEPLIRVGSHLAMLAAQQGELDEAEQRFLRALELRRARSGDAHPELAEIANNLGMLYRDTGRLAQAEEHLRMALHAFRVGVGEQHPDVATCLQNLAGVCFLSGQLDEAGALAREAVALHRAALPEGHPDLGTSLNTLGVILHRQGRASESAIALREAHAVRARGLGPTAPDTLDTAVGLAQVLVSMGGRDELTEAVGLLTGVVAGAEARGLGDADANVAKTRLLIGRCLLALGREAEAEPVLLRAEVGLVESLGGAAEPVRDARQHLVLLYTTLGDDASAERWRALLAASP